MANAPIAPVPSTRIAAPATPETTPQRTPAQPSKERYKNYLRVKIGSLEYTSLRGDILGQPYIRCSSYQHSSARIILNDPDDKIRLEVEKQQTVEIEIGYVGGDRQNVLIGELYYVGRVPPDGTEIEVIDKAASLQQTGSSVQNAAEKPVVSTVVLNKKAKATPQPTPPESFPVQQSSPDGFTALSNLLEQTSRTTTGGTTPVTPAEQVTAQNQDLQFRNKSKSAINATGSVRLTQGGLQSAQQSALLQGDVVVARGNTVEQVSPGAGQSSGVVLNFRENPSLMIGRPRITKKTPLQLQSAFGSITVVGWNPAAKERVAATIVTPGPAPEHPTGNIDVPEWGAIKLRDPIYPGCIYTWADATKNGTRVPESRAIMQAIARIARVMQDLSNQYNGGRKFQINSWYRDPASNRRVGGASRSRHLNGDAVDFFHPNMARIHQNLNGSWDGGVAIRPGSFVHIDLGPRRRWRY